MTLKSGSEVTEGIENGTIRKLDYTFLFAFHSNYGRIFSIDGHGLGLSTGWVGLDIVALCIVGL